jgi:small nuclear ribonucleoprotein G
MRIRLQFMDKRLFIQVQGGRKVSGVLRGFDIFLNIVLDDSMEETVPGKKTPIGQVVSFLGFSRCLSE